MFFKSIRIRLNNAALLILIGTSLGALSTGWHAVSAQTAEPTPEATALVVDSTPSGSPLTLVWQTGVAPDEILVEPNHLALDAQGNIYVGTEATTGSVRVFDSDGKFVREWGNAGSSDGQFFSTQGIGFDAQGNVYVGDFDKVQVQKFDSTGKFLTQWATESPIGPTGLAVDLQGNVYVANHRTHDHYIQKFDGSGKLLAQWGSTGSGDGQIGAGLRSGPEDLAVDQQGNVYIADSDNNRIEKFDSNGNFLASFGTQGVHGNGQFTKPFSVAVDGQGNIYVADWYFIQKLDATGKFLAQWPTNSGELKDAGQIRVDAQGNLYTIASARVTTRGLAGGTLVTLVTVLKKFSQS